MAPKSNCACGSALDRFAGWLADAALRLNGDAIILGPDDVTRRDRTCGDFIRWLDASAQTRRTDHGAAARDDITAIPRSATCKSSRATTEHAARMRSPGSLSLRDATGAATRSMSPIAVHLVGVRALPTGVVQSVR